MPEVVWDKSTKTAEFIWCWPSGAGHGPALSVACIPREIPLEKNILSSLSSCQSEIASCLETGLVSTSSCQLWDWTWPCACRHSFCELLRSSVLSCLDDNIVSCEASILSDSSNPSTLPSTHFSETQGEGFEDHILFKTELQSFSLLHIIQMCVSGLVLLHPRGKLLWWWMNETWIQGCSRIS